jgi:hypothetical protein
MLEEKEDISSIKGVSASRKVLKSSIRSVLAENVNLSLTHRQEKIFWAADKEVFRRENVFLSLIRREEDVISSLIHWRE